MINIINYNMTTLRTQIFFGIVLPDGQKLNENKSTWNAESHRTAPKQHNDDDYTHTHIKKAHRLVSNTCLRAKQQRTCTFHTFGFAIQSISVIQYSFGCNLQAKSKKSLKWSAPFYSFDYIVPWWFLTKNR